ncbi:MAG: PAS domain-containing protein [Acidobacteria bacterium]|nr:PAS domain-containing protein [Acidobacteriota bacterium]
MRLKLFWQFGLAFLGLLLAVLLAVDIFAARTLRRDYLRDAFDQLAALGKVAQARPPQLDDPTALRSWVAWLAQGGARITVISADGRVLADSAHDPEAMENHAGRPEIRQALASGEGRSVRHSDTLDRDLVYLALRQQPAGGQAVVLRLALPLKRIDEALAEIRWRLAGASLVILLVAGTIALGVSRAFSARVRRLEAFSRRVADGDFRPLPLERRGDELTALTRSLNETAARLDQTIRTLTDERNRSAAILRSMVEGVAVISAEERILFCNEAFARILGLQAGKSEGRRLVEVTRQAELLGVVKQVLAGREGVRSWLVMGTVRPRSFAVTAAPIAAAGANAGTEATAGAVLVLHDISELRRLERVRRDFVANVSHEFKTPLTAIQGFAETLLAGALEDQENRPRFLEIISEHARRLGRLTDDLLKLAQIEAEQMELDFRAVSVAELIEGCVETTRLRAEQKQLTLAAECPDGLPAVGGDRARLAEVLQNLLDNAVQYTPAGGRVTLRARAAEREVIITVSDTGIGIPQADQERIFERFYRVDAARSREVGGTGLGLSIAKHIVEAHGGRIWVESTVGQGSDFHFSIPAMSPSSEVFRA